MPPTFGERSSPTASPKPKISEDAQPSRVAVNETVVKINGGRSWLYTSIDLDTPLVRGMQLFGRHETDSVAAFCIDSVRNTTSQIPCFVGQLDYRTALARLGLGCQVDFTDQTLIEKWFHTLKLRVDCFHNSWEESAERPLMACVVCTLLQPS